MWNGIPGTGKSNFQHACVYYATVGCINTGGISVGKIWRITYGMVVIPDCGEYVTCGINDISYEDLQKNHQTAAG